MKLGDPDEVTSCGSIMEYGGQHGNQMSDETNLTRKFEAERYSAKKEHQREPIRPATPPGGVIRTTASSEQVKFSEQDDKDLVFGLDTEAEQEKPRSSDRRRMSPATRDGAKLNSNCEHIEQQQRQTKQKSHHHHHQQQQQQQQHNQSDSQALTKRSQSSEVSPGANLLLHINHLSSQITSAASRLSTKQRREAHHELDNSAEHNQSSSLGPSSAASVIDYITTSPSVALAAAAAAAQSVREQNQRRQEILGQFASLHSLSAVASAIQQTHTHLELLQQRQVEHSQFTKETAPRSHSSRFELAHSMQRQQQQQQPDSQQLQAFSLANFATLSNHQQLPHELSTRATASSMAQNVPSSGLLLASSSNDCNQLRSLDLPMDLHRQKQQAGPARNPNEAQAAIDMANQEATRSVLMDLMRRSSLLPHLAEANFRQSFVQLNQTTGVRTQNDANNLAQHNSLFTASSQVHQQIYPAPARPMGLRVGRKRGSRKCRKMYGMGQRQLWCTQCKWKKACSRFLCANQLNLGFSNGPSSVLVGRGASLAEGGANCCGGPALGPMIEFGAQSTALAQNSIAGERGLG